MSENETTANGVNSPMNDSSPNKWRLSVAPMMDGADRREKGLTNQALR